MIVLLLQLPHELLAIHDGLRIPDAPSSRRTTSRPPFPGGSGLADLFERGVHFDDLGTCYVWHTNSNCYAIPINIWSHPASPIRDRILRHWPHGEQLSFWLELFDPIVTAAVEFVPVTTVAAPAVAEGLAGKRR